MRGQTSFIHGLFGWSDRTPPPPIYLGPGPGEVHDNTHTRLFEKGFPKISRLNVTICVRLCMRTGLMEIYRLVQSPKKVRFDPMPYHHRMQRRKNLPKRHREVYLLSVYLERVDGAPKRVATSSDATGDAVRAHALTNKRL